MWERAKARALAKGLEFSITIDNIKIPDRCPVFGTDWEESRPSLDRKDSRLGYTPDNIQVISVRANTLKNNATLQELETLVEWIKMTA